MRCMCSKLSLYSSALLDQGQKAQHFAEGSCFKFSWLSRQIQDCPKRMCPHLTRLRHTVRTYKCYSSALHFPKEKGEVVLRSGGMIRSITFRKTKSLHDLSPQNYLWQSSLFLHFLDLKTVRKQTTVTALLCSSSSGNKQVQALWFWKGCRAVCEKSLDFWAT